MTKPTSQSGLQKVPRVSHKPSRYHKKQKMKSLLKSPEMSHEPNFNWGCCYLVQKKSCMFLGFLFCIILLFSSLQTTLATFGIETQTPQQIEPIQIWPPSELVKVIFQNR